MTLPASILTKSQKLHFTADSKDINKAVVTVDGVSYSKVVAQVRFDDQCSNGHNTFSITGDAYEVGYRRDPRNPSVCGCIHEIIAAAFPELAPLIKWHLVSSDGPMHYLANTTYHARTCTHEGKQPGDAVRFETRLKFSGFPMTFEEQCPGFWDWMDEQRGKDACDLVVREVPHANEPGTYSANYSFEGFKSTRNLNGNEWYDCPFKDRRAADEWRLCMLGDSWEFVQEPIAWAKAVEPNIEAARNCAIWPEATLEQLQDKELLTARLPELMTEFKAAVESLGLVY